MAIRNRFAELHPEITGWRRHLHSIPELEFDLPKTSAFVEGVLREMGITDITTGIAQTGIVAVIEGRTNTSGRVIGLRADMDALPIDESTDLDFASTHAGTMHACGHDGHTAMLLGAAKYLHETRNFDGKVVLLFQPAEEVGSGAKAMIDDGCMDRWGVDEVYGLHNMPGMAAGQFAIRPGPVMAATDEFFITVQGRGGHAAAPHETVDTTVLASHMVVALQSIVARNMDPVKQGVLSVTAFTTSSTAFNVIPDSVRLRGTVRSHAADMQDMIEARISEVAHGVAATFGGSAQVEYLRHVPITINSDEPAAFAADVARSVSGACAEAPLIMGGEDFSYMLQSRPGAFIFLGNGDSAGLHHPAYAFNDESIPAGASWFAELVEQRLRA